MATMTKYPSNSSASSHVKSFTSASSISSRVQTSALAVPTKTSFSSTSPQFGITASELPRQTTSALPVYTPQPVINTPTPSAVPTSSDYQEPAPSTTNPQKAGFILIAICLGLLGVAILMFLWTSKRMQKKDANKKGGGPPAHMHLHSIDEPQRQEWEANEERITTNKRGMVGPIDTQTPGIISNPTGNKRLPESTPQAGHQLDSATVNEGEDEFWTSPVLSYKKQDLSRATRNDSKVESPLDPSSEKNLKQEQVNSPERLSGLIRQAQRYEELENGRMSVTANTSPNLTASLRYSARSWMTSRTSLSSRFHFAESPFDIVKVPQQKQLRPPERLSGLIRQALQYDETESETVPVTVTTPSNSAHSSRHFARSQINSSASLSSILSFAKSSFDIIAVPLRTAEFYKPSRITLKSTQRSRFASGGTWRMSSDTFTIDPLMMNNFPRTTPLSKLFPEVPGKDRAQSAMRESPEPVFPNSRSSDERNSSPFIDLESNESCGFHDGCNQEETKGHSQEVENHWAG